jgi:hypothetical protein
MLFFPDFDLQQFEKPRIEQVASAALEAAPRSVTTAVNPRSAGGPHDFSSEGDYWWPDPAKPGGPYIQRDGLTNPDNFVAHRRLMLDMARDVGALAAAWKVTRDERYAAAAVRHLLAWFVHPDTRMNPSLLYAQAISGRVTGRGIGVIDTLHLAEVALAVEALRGSVALTPAADAALTGWFRDYLHWMRTHPYGIEESKALNNHGTCWTLQAACFARLTGDAAVLAECRRRLKEEHLPNQMAPDGSFPLELRRTKPYGYAIFNLDVMTALAVVLSTPEENLMTWALPDGRSLAKGVAWLAPYLADKGRWLREVKRHRQTAQGTVPTDEPVQPDVMYWDYWPIRQPCLLFGALATGRREWLELWQRLPADPTTEEIRRNYPVREPVLWAL